MGNSWEKNYVKGAPKSIQFEDITLPAALARTAARFPDRPSLMFQGTVVTFRELEQMVSRFASALIGMDVQPGDRVSLLLPNLIQTAVGIYGALRAGATVVMHSPRLDNLQMEYQLKNAGSELVVGLDVLVPRLINLRERTRVKKIVSCHIRDYLPFLKKKLFPLVKSQLHLETPDDEGVVEFTDLTEGSLIRDQKDRPGMNDTAFILYTSGTTGKSKGVELTHGNVSRNVQQGRSWFPTFKDGEEIVVGCLPFFHVFGLTTALNLGIFYGFGDVLVPIPEPKSVLEAIHAYKATYLPAIPGLYIGMLHDANLKKYDLTSLKGCFSGAAPLPLETIRSFEKITGAQICEGYGQTECSPVSHINPFGGKTKAGTIGVPLPNTEAKIVDVDDFTREITTPDEPGELCLRGPQIMKGYWNLPEETDATIRDGWLLTGDIVTMDKEGYFTFVDRKHDMIVSRGQKIFPRDVDEVLFSHPKVLEACTVGVRDGIKGQSVKAFVVLKKNERATAQEIIDYCKKKLPVYKVPESVDFETELPKSLVGKIVRNDLKRRHLAKEFSNKSQASRQVMTR